MECKLGRLWGSGLGIVTESPEGGNAAYVAPCSSSPDRVGEKIGRLG